jgi:phenylalanyl-tRNA synthetase beta chain
MAHQSRNLRVFEIGNTFISRGSDQQPEEIEIIAGLWTGDRFTAGWYDKATPCDFYDLKGSVEALLEDLHIQDVKFRSLPADECTYTRPGATARIVLGDQELGVLGTMGEVHPQVLSTYELKQTAFIFELHLDALLIAIPPAISSRPLPKYPSTVRDATLIIDSGLEADDLLQQIRQMREPLVEEIRMFDVFSGAPIARGRKSISLRVTYRSPDATLEDNVVNDLHTRLMAGLIETFKADLPA